MTVLFALLIEWRTGDSVGAYHPVAAFGGFADWIERLLYRDTRAAGGLAWTLAVGSGTSLVALALALAGYIGLASLAGAVVLWATLGWRSLREHALAVLDAPDLDAARNALSHIVGRDVESLSSIDVRRATLESLAENASDAVVAPLFWAVVGGPLAAAVYRFINTLDAMWGHRSPRYEQFGWAAARADDLVNWVPARLTAALFLLAARCWPESGWRGQATAHASPNAGWPETAIAHGLHVRLGGPVWRSSRRDIRAWMGPKEAPDPSEASLKAGVKLTHETLLIAAGLAILTWR